MKQYTNSEQTAKLIELGFEKPKGWRVEGISSRLRMCVDINRDEGFNYSIGELMEMLPMSILHELWWGTEDEGVWGLRIGTEGTEYIWKVSYERELSPSLYCEARSELIDALYDMIIFLNKEGII